MWNFTYLRVLMRTITGHEIGSIVPETFLLSLCTIIHTGRTYSQMTFGDVSRHLSYTSVDYLILRVMPRTNIRKKYAVMASALTAVLRFPSFFGFRQADGALLEEQSHCLLLQRPTGN